MNNGNYPVLIGLTFDNYLDLCYHFLTDPEVSTLLGFVAFSHHIDSS